MSKIKPTELPRVVSRDEWLRARRELLAKEKEFTRQRDRMNADRRKLPMVLVEKDYRFDGPDGERSLRDLFEGRRQLLVYHFMFDPEWEEGCPSCSLVADHFGGALPHLAARNTTLVAVSRAPLGRIEPFKKRMGWNFPWLSSFANDFNFDFQATVDEEQQEYNFQTYYPIAHEMFAKRKGPPPGEVPGLSVFLRDEKNVYHAYSTYLRGLDLFVNTYNFLDHTPLGRQEEPGRPMEWVRYHDSYSDGVTAGCGCGVVEEAGH